MRGIISMAESFPREELMPRNKQPEIFNFLKYQLCIVCTFCKEERCNTCVLHQKMKTSTKHYKTFCLILTNNLFLSSKNSYFIWKLS
jgi:hypothetical protein